jgi:protein CpxP
MGRGMGRRPMESVDDQIKHLSKKLNLTSDQQAKLKPILEDQRKQMEAVHNDSSLSREDKFSKMQALRQSSDTQIKGVLTDEQSKSFDKMREEQRDRMKQWHGGANAPPAGASPDSQQQ